MSRFAPAWAPELWCTNMCPECLPNPHLPMSPTHARANNAHPPHLVAQLVMVYNSHHYDAQVIPGGGCGAS